MRKFCAALFVTLATTAAWAQVGRSGNVLYEDDGSSDKIFGPHLIPVVAGAAAGYFIERAYNKSKLDKEGGLYSSEYLGGKMGALIGAVAGPLLVGFLLR